MNFVRPENKHIRRRVIIKDDPRAQEFAGYFVNLVLSYGYSPAESKKILELCEHKLDKEISLIVKGMNESIAQGDE